MLGLRLGTLILKGAVQYLSEGFDHIRVVGPWSILLWSLKWNL